MISSNPQNPQPSSHATSYISQDLDRNDDASLSLLGAELGGGVGDLDTKDLGARDDLNALLGRDTVGDGGGVLARVHEEELEVADVVDENLLVAGGDEVAGLVVGSVTNLGHGGLALEATADLGYQHSSRSEGDG